MLRQMNSLLLVVGFAAISVIGQPQRPAGKVEAPEVRLDAYRQYRSSLVGQERDSTSHRVRRAETKQHSDEDFGSSDYDSEGETDQMQRSDSSKGQDHDFHEAPPQNSTDDPKAFGRLRKFDVRQFQGLQGTKKSFGQN